MIKVLIGLIGVLYITALNANDMDVADKALVNNDIKTALVFYEKACNNGNAEACYSLGLLFEEGDGIQQNYTQAEKFYGKACEMNYSMGCHCIGLLSVVQNDYLKAISYYDKSCNMNHMGSCHNLAELYYNGESIRQDYTKAANYYGKSCDKGIKLACKNYAILNTKGY